MFYFVDLLFRSVVRYLRSKNIATVGVGFPATEMMLGRIRFCISAAHTKQQLDYVSFIK